MLAGGGGVLTAPGCLILLLSLAPLALGGCGKKVCEPGATKPCLRCGSYTKGVPYSPHGKQVCTADGKRWSACRGPRQGRALIAAAGRGDLEAVRRHLAGGADVNARAPGCLTPLMAAARGGHLAVVRALLARKADPLAHTSIEPRATHRGATALYLAVAATQRAVAEVLLNAGVPVDRGNLEQETPLHLAASRGYVDLARKLIAAGADVNAKGAGHRRPLHVAIRGNRPALVKLLLEHEADPGARDKDGNTPLHTAARHHRVELIRPLVAAGADVNAGGGLGEPPLHMAIVRRSGGRPDGALATVRALIAAGADVNRSYKAPASASLTPLHNAAQACRLELVRALVKAGARPNVKDSEGHTPLHLARFQRKRGSCDAATLRELRALGLE
jgi:ankyrin repeat protein